MNQTIVFKVNQCHICDENVNYEMVSKLRQHLRNYHGIQLKGKAGRRKKDASENKYITKKQLKEHTVYETWFMCPGCDYHFIELKNLVTHFNIHHIINVDSTLEKPFNLPTEKRQIDHTSSQPTKMLSKEKINQNIFRFETENEAKLVNGIMNTYNIQSSLMTFTDNNNHSISISLATSQKDLEILKSFNNQTIAIKIDPAATELSEEYNFQNDDYVYSCLKNSVYFNLFRYGDYIEMNDEIVDFLNTDWRDKDYYRIAVGHVLTGAILLEKYQILLINGCEIYNRNPSVDIHHERFGSEYMQSSMPSMINRYKKINITTKVEDRSRKLLIGTLVFNALVVSSLRLDGMLEPEVGASTFSFTPSQSTKIFISRLSVEKANRAVEKNEVYFNHHSYDSQLRQLRSYLTSPHTYKNARVFSEWTDNILCRPFTIFSFADKSGVDRRSECIIASNILKKVAEAMRFNDCLLKKDALNEFFILQDKSDSTMKILNDFEKIFADKNEISLIGNEAVELLLVKLAVKVTNRLKDANDNVKKNILKSCQNF